MEVWRLKVMVWLLPMILHPWLYDPKKDRRRKRKKKKVRFATSISNIVVKWYNTSVIVANHQHCMNCGKEPYPDGRRRKASRVYTYLSSASIDSVFSWKWAITLEGESTSSFFLLSRPSSSWPSSSPSHHHQSAAAAPSVAAGLFS